MWSAAGWAAAGRRGRLDGRLAVAANSGSVQRLRQPRPSASRASLPATAARCGLRTGRLLASYRPRYAVQIRRGGVGAPILRWPARNAGSLQWIGATTLRFQGPNGWVGVDVAHNRTSESTWTRPRRTTASSRQSGRSHSPSSMQAGRTAGAMAALHASALPAASDARERPLVAPTIERLRPASRSCPTEPGRDLPDRLSCSPPADIYSVNPDGSGLRPGHEHADSTRWSRASSAGRARASSTREQLAAGKCDGCAADALAQSLGAGGTPQQLTSHSDRGRRAVRRESATWSPDGSADRLPEQRGRARPIRLLTMPADRRADERSARQRRRRPRLGAEAARLCRLELSRTSSSRRSTPRPATVKVGRDRREDRRAGARLVGRAAASPTSTPTNAQTTRSWPSSARRRRAARPAAPTFPRKGAGRRSRLVAGRHARFAFAATDARTAIGEIDHDRRRRRRPAPADPRTSARLYNVGYESTISWR